MFKHLLLFAWLSIVLTEDTKKSSHPTATQSVHEKNTTHLINALLNATHTTNRIKHVPTQTYLATQSIDAKNTTHSANHNKESTTARKHVKARYVVHDCNKQLECHCPQGMVEYYYDHDGCKQCRCRSKRSANICASIICSSEKYCEKGMCMPYSTKQYRRYARSCLPMMKMCMIYCPHGYVYKHGCKTCKCREEQTIAHN